MAARKEDIALDARFDDLNSAIDSFEAMAYGSDTDGGELSRQRSLSIDAYSGKNIEPAPDGRSQVGDRSVFETIQWILPSLTRIFAGGDNVVEFEPTGPEDERAAEQESEVLNHLVTRKNNWFLTCLTWFQDALLTKNAYVLAFMEEKFIVEKEVYENQSEEQVALLLQEDGVELTESSIREEEGEPQPAIDPLSGQPMLDEAGNAVMVPTINVIYDIELKRTTPKKQLQFRVLPPERCLVDQNTSDFTLEDCDYFEYWDNETISDLRKQGLDVDDDIGDDPDHDTNEDQSRDEILSFTNRDKSELPDPSMRMVKVRTVWIRYDFDEDGIAELQRVIRVGNEILDRREVTRIPVACIVPFLNTHRHIGQSASDLIFEVQRIKTALLRAGLDSLYLSTNPRHAASDKVNLDDLLVSRPGGVVRLKAGAVPGEGHIMPLPTEFVFPQAQEGLLHMDTVIESRVGVNRIFQGIDEGQLNDHNRIGQLSTMAAQRVEQIARIFANGVERLFSLSHELLIKSGHKADAIRLRGEWVNFDPSQWRTGRDMRIVAPFAAGNKDALVQRLMILGQFQEKIMAGGLRVVTEDDVYALAQEVSKAMDVSGDKFFTDPATLPPPEPGPDYTMMALEVENKKADNQAADSQIDAEVTKYKTDIDAEMDKYKADLDAQVKQYQTDVNTQLQLAITQMKEGQQVNVETVKARLRDEPIEAKNDVIAKTSDNVKILTDTIKELAEAANAPREVIRDKDGKVTGIKQGGKTRKVTRGADGTVTGVE